MTRITVVSSDHQHLDEITRILKSDASMGEVTALRCGADELEHLRDVPDVLVMNGKLPDQGGLDSLERLGQRHPGTAFIVVSDNHSPDFLLRAMRAGVREVLPTPSVGEQLRAAIGRIVQKRPTQAEEGKILAVISCKGGSGATFLATNLAYALAGDGHRVALVDLNLQFGDAAMFVTEHKPASTLADVCRQIHRLDAAFLSSAMIQVAPNFELLAAPGDPGQAVDVKAEHVAAILRVARANYDFVLVDASRSLDPVSLATLDMADVILPVMQLTLPFIRDAKRLVEVFVSLGYPLSKLRFVINRYHRDEEISLKSVEQAVGVTVFKTVPNSYAEVAASVNQGVPIARLAKHNPVTRALAELARALGGTPATAGKGLFARLFRAG